MDRERLIRDLGDLEARKEAHRIAVRQNDDELFRQVLYHQMLDRGLNLYWDGYSRTWESLTLLTQDIRYRYPERYTVEAGSIREASLSWSPEKAQQWCGEVFHQEVRHLKSLRMPYLNDFHALLNLYVEALPILWDLSPEGRKELILRARILCNKSNVVHTLIEESVIAALQGRVGLAARHLIHTRVLDKVDKLDGIGGSQRSLVPRDLRQMSISLFIDNAAVEARTSLARILCDL